MALFDKMKQQLVFKRRGKILKGILFLQDNAGRYRAAIKHQKLADLNFKVLKHPANSPDVATSNYYYFPNLKKHLKGRKFLSIVVSTLAGDGWFAAQQK
jgi:hypothetical protein